MCILAFLCLGFQPGIASEPVLGKLVVALQDCNDDDPMDCIVPLAPHLHGGQPHGGRRLAQQQKQKSLSLKKVLQDHSDEIEEALGEHLMCTEKSIRLASVTADEHESVVFAGFAMHLVFEGLASACKKNITLHSTMGLDTKFQYALMAWAKVTAPVVPEYEADVNQWRMFLLGNAVGLFSSAIFFVVSCIILRNHSAYASITDREDCCKIGKAHHVPEAIPPSHDDDQLGSP